MSFNVDNTIIYFGMKIFGITTIESILNFFYRFTILRDQATNIWNINNYMQNYYYLISWYAYFVSTNVDVFIALEMKLAI